MAAGPEPRVRRASAVRPSPRGGAHLNRPDEPTLPLLGHSSARCAGGCPRRPEGSARAGMFLFGARRWRCWARCSSSVHGGGGAGLDVPLRCTAVAVLVSMFLFGDSMARARTRRSSPAHTATALKVARSCAWDVRVPRLMRPIGTRARPRASLLASFQRFSLGDCLATLLASLWFLCWCKELGRPCRSLSRLRCFYRRRPLLMAASRLAR